MMSRSKISKRTREQAARICALAASTPCSLADAHVELGIGATWSLALGARLYAAEQLRGRVTDEERYRISCAEAEAMLRTGWTPS